MLLFSQSKIITFIVGVPCIKGEARLLRHQTDNRPTGLGSHCFLGAENVDTLAWVDCEQWHGLLSVGLEKVGEAETLG